jgi:hypothetical protein
MTQPALSLVAALLLACPLPAAAQDRARTWLAGGYGVGGAKGGREGATYMGELVHQRGANHFALRGVAVEEPFGPGTEPLVDLGLLYGRVAKGRTGHAALAAGVAFAAVDGCGGSSRASCGIVSLPVVAEAAVRLGSVLGVGVQAFANLNKKQSFGGVVVFVQLGWLP